MLGSACQGIFFFPILSPSLLILFSSSMKQEEGAGAPMIGSRHSQRLNVFLFPSHPRKVVASRGSLRGGQNNEGKTLALAGKGGDSGSLIWRLKERGN